MRTALAVKRTHFRGLIMHPGFRRTISLATIVLCATAAPLHAQANQSGWASSTKGFFLGAHLNGSAVRADDLFTDTQSGGGFGIHLGFGFTQKIAAFAELTGAALDVDGETVGFGHFDLGARYTFTGPSRRWAPSLEAAFTGRALTQSDVDLLGDGTTGDLTVQGNGFSFGGGLQYFATPKVAVGASLKWTTGEFDKVTYRGDSESGLGMDGTSSRFNVGVTWYPAGGR